MRREGEREGERRRQGEGGKDIEWEGVGVERGIREGKEKERGEGCHYGVLLVSVLPWGHQYGLPVPSHSMAAATSSSGHNWGQGHWGKHHDSRGEAARHGHHPLLHLPCSRAVPLTAQSLVTPHTTPSTTSSHHPPLASSLPPPLPPPPSTPSLPHNHYSPNTSLSQFFFPSSSPALLLTARSTPRGWSCWHCTGLWGGRGCCSCARAHF